MMVDVIDGHIIGIWRRWHGDFVEGVRLGVQGRGCRIKAKRGKEFLRIYNLMMGNLVARPKMGKIMHNCRGRKKTA